MAETQLHWPKASEKHHQGLFIGTEARERARDLISGFVSGALCKTVEYPLDTIKVLLQSADGKSAQYASVSDCLRQTYYRNGPLGFYKGIGSPLAGAALENSTLFVTYGTMKRTLNVNDNPTLLDPVPMWKYMICGAGSGVFSAFVLTPVELLKCRLQVQNSGGPKLYKGVLDCLVQTVRSDGFTGLWKGNVSCLAREVPGNMAWFTVYEFVRGRVLQRLGGYERRNDMPLGLCMVAGAFAGVAYWVVPYPADTLKSRIQTSQVYANLSFFKAFRKLHSEIGLRGMYRGCALTCARAAPSNALLFYVYEVTSNTLGTL